MHFERLFGSMQVHAVQVIIVIHLGCLHSQACFCFTQQLSTGSHHCSSPNVGYIVTAGGGEESRVE